MKVYINNFEIQDNDMIFQNPIVRSYEKRKTKDGLVTTVHGHEIQDLKDLLRAQLNDIKNHCEYVRLYDTYHNNVVKEVLKDDNW